MSSIARDGILNDDAGTSSKKGSNQTHGDKDRTRSPSAVADDELKQGEGGSDVRMTDTKPTYKSWKKKYRKMRIKFDQLQAQNEELYQLEQKALKKTKQLAIYNDRLLDVLLDINNRPQIPLEKRFDLSLPVASDAEEELIHSVDKEPPKASQATKSLKEMIKDVPHLDFSATSDRFPEALSDLITGVNSPAADVNHRKHPPNFLTADDIDNYLWEIDCQSRMEAEDRGEDVELPPTLAPLAREQVNGAGFVARGTTPSSAAPHAKDTSAAGASSVSTSSRDFALRNPTSVYNWLRKHAPKTFLQDNEGGDDKKEKGGEKSTRKVQRAEEEDDDEESRPAPRKGAGGSARKATGEGRASTSAARAKAERSSKRSSASHAKDKRKSLDDTMYDLDDELGFDSPSAAAASQKGKRKRISQDDDTGYRPKGGSSRKPPKKRTKNNSLGGTNGDDKIVSTVQGELAASRKKDTAKTRDDTSAAEIDTEG